MDSITFELATIKSKKDFILALRKLSKLLHESHIFSDTLTIKRTCVPRTFHFQERHFTSTSENLMVKHFTFKRDISLPLLRI